jgi:hypothetical protein
MELRDNNYNALEQRYSKNMPQIDTEPLKGEFKMNRFKV